MLTLYDASGPVLRLPVNAKTTVGTHVQEVTFGDVPPTFRVGLKRIVLTLKFSEGGES
jgi:hypothetical protein